MYHVLQSLSPLVCAAVQGECTDVTAAVWRVQAAAGEGGADSGGDGG